MSTGLHLFIEDNSAQALRLPPKLAAAYSWDGSNPGLAARYEDAAVRAEAAGCDWLMLLDQDTAVTADYICEVRRTLADEILPEGVDALVPTVRDGKRVLSPHRRVRLRTRPVPGPLPGVVEEPCSWINSGTVLRLSAVRAIGGFPTDYPLDYLDHVVATRLQQHGSRVWALASVLEHHLSVLGDQQIPKDRMTSVLDAEARFYREYGTIEDAAWLALRRTGRAARSTLHRGVPIPAGAAWTAAAASAKALFDRLRVRHDG